MGTGSVSLPVGGELTYSYDPLTTNVNGRTLKGLSTGAEAKMYSCGLGCPMAEFMKFYDYYGRFDYANHWIESAFQGSQTDFTNGNVNMGIYGYDGRGQRIKKATAYISVWMYIVREMLDAINDCNANFGTCNGDDGMANVNTEIMAQ